MHTRLAIVSVFALLVSTISVATATVPVWNATLPWQVTQNATDDHAPSVNGEVAVWSGFDGHDDEIYMRDMYGGPVQAITNNDFDDERPVIHVNGALVWQGFDGQDWEIFARSYPGVLQVTHNTTDDTNPQVNLDGRIVWQGYDGADLDIFSANYDGSNIRVISDAAAAGTPPPDDVNPQINDWGVVTWAGRVGGQWDIFAAQVDGTGRVNLSNSPAVDDEEPQIGETSTVSWQGRFSPTNTEIFTAPASGAGPVVRLTNDARLDLFPHIGGYERAVWMTEMAPGEWDIHTAAPDGSHAEVITDWPGAELYPVIDEAGIVAWQGYDGNDWEIFARVGTQNFQLTDNAVDDGRPSVWKGHLYPSGCPDPCGRTYPATIWVATPGGGVSSTGEIWVLTYTRQAAVGATPPGPVVNLPQLQLAGGNPVHGVAEFRLALPAAAEARVDVLDLLGRLTTTLRQGLQPAGEDRLLWDGRDATGVAVASGLYFVRLRSGRTEVVRKVALTR